jgi:hypothetical protein
VKQFVMHQNLVNLGQRYPEDPEDPEDPEELEPRSVYPLCAIKKFGRLANLAEQRGYFRCASALPVLFWSQQVHKKLELCSLYFI